MRCQFLPLRRYFVEALITSVICVSYWGVEPTQLAHELKMVVHALVAYYWESFVIRDATLLISMKNLLGIIIEFDF